MNVITFLLPYYNEDRGSDSLSHNINVFVLWAPTSPSSCAQFRRIIGAADVSHIARSDASPLLNISLGSLPRTFAINALLLPADVVQCKHSQRIQIRDHRLFLM